jgi:AraC-like DNA-binding protein
MCLSPEFGFSRERPLRQIILSGLELNDPASAFHDRASGIQPMATDALSNLLRTVRLTGATFFNIAAQDSWAVGSPAPAAILPKILPGADHLIAYHVVTAGRCFACRLGGEPIALEAGEVVVFTRGDAHVMSSGPGMRADPPTADVLEIAFAGRLPFYINYANGGPGSTNLVCGYLACDSQPFNPLLEALPSTIKGGAPNGGEADWLSQFIRFAVAEVADKRAGGDIVLTKLSELMFVDVLRRYIANLPSEKSGWLAGLRDPVVGKALSLIHDKPVHGWTIEALARQSGASRAVLAERFAALVGAPQMHYLAKWRMQIASELLASGSANIARISADVGYESEAAFSRAFKKMTGVPPSAWRLGIVRSRTGASSPTKISSDRSAANRGSA